MADNVFRYRSFKWDDPEKKLRMLPPDEPSRSGGFLRRAVALLVAAGVGFAGVTLATIMWPIMVSVAAQTLQVAHADCRIKGNISIDTGERWSCSEAEARRASWRKAHY